MLSRDSLVLQRVLKFKVNPLLVCFSPRMFSSTGADTEQVENWFCEGKCTKRRARELGESGEPIHPLVYHGIETR